MQIEQQRIEQAAQVSGISVEDLTAFLAVGAVQHYGSNEWLFQESTPRLWAGIILEGEVKIVRGLHGSSRHIATMLEGSLISEGLLLDDDAHANGAYSRNGARVWQISKEKLATYRQQHPDIFYRIVARVAVGVNRRMRLLSDQLFANKQESGQVSGFRLEHDSLGQREISNQAYYGVQTLRAMENFAISGVFVRNFEHLIEGLAMVKKAVAAIKADGKEKTFSAIDDPNGPYRDRDLYVVVYDLSGKCLAHGANPKQIGKDLLELRDPDGTLLSPEAFWNRAHRPVHGESVAASFGPLKEGDRGAQVRELQQALVGLGLTDANGAPLEADSAFGPRTGEAVRAFQAMGVDGMSLKIMANSTASTTSARVMLIPCSMISHPGSKTEK